MLRETFDAFLVDFDGVQVNTVEPNRRHWKQWISQLGWVQAGGLSVDALFQEAHGRRTRDAMEEFAERATAAGRPFDVEASFRWFEDISATDFDGMVPVAGAREALSAVQANQWITVTGGDRSTTAAIARAFDMPQSAQMVANTDVLVGKPDPEGYLLGAAKLGVDPARCLVIEDAPAGIRAGHAAGAKVLAVATTKTIADLRDEPWDFLAEDLSALQVLDASGSKLIVALEPLAVAQSLGR